MREAMSKPAAPAVPLPQSLVANPRLATWMHFDAAAQVVEVRVGKVEIGQGIGTALLQIAADELRVAPSRIRLVAGRTDSTPDEQWTSASISVEVGGAALRRVCAEVRTLFAQQAAEQLGLPMLGLRLVDGFFFGEDQGSRLSYWDLIEHVTLDRSYSGIQPFLPADPAPVTHVGTPMPRMDLDRKLRGEGFIHDMRVPGMRHACVLRAPRAGCTLASIDADAIKRLPGVDALVVDGSFVALCGSDEHAIRLAQVRAQAHLTWRAGPLLPTASNLEAFLRGLRTEPRRIVAPAQPGDATNAEAPTHRLCATYLRPYLAHASIGTCCALACPTAGGMTVYSHSQGVFPLRDSIARVLGLASVQVTIIHADGAGCYGHNGADDVALEAALVARAVGQPVRIAWSRDEELRMAPFGPAMMVDIDAGVAADGRVTHWKHSVTSTTHLVRPGWGSGVNLLAAAHLAQPHAPSAITDPPQAYGGAGDRNAIPLYRFGQADAQCTVDYRFSSETPLRTSALRSLGAHANVFAIESMLDELANAAGIDPLALRLANLDDPRARAVLQTAADMSGWGTQSAGQGARGWGIGFGQYKNRAAYFAAVVELEISHVIRVARVHAAVDCGLAVNPDGVLNQVEGGIVQAISWTLKEQVRWSADGVLTAGWEDYPVLRFDEVPALDIRILARPNDPPLGVGECTMGPVAAAIANALAHALAVRVREMPITVEAVNQL